jgi:transposase
LLFVGDDWAEDHHDVELQDDSGRVLARRRLVEGIAGIADLHALIVERCEGSDGAQHVSDEVGVVVGIETDRGPWVEALIAAGYQVFAINPKQASRFKERYAVSGAKSDKGDAHALADMVRIDRDQLRPVAGDTSSAQAIKVVARAHQTMVWERTRAMLRLRSALRDYFPAALAAYEQLGLAGADTLELLQAAPSPAQAAALDVEVVIAALRRMHRHRVHAKAAAITAVLRKPHLGRSGAVTEAYASTVSALSAVIAVFNTQIKRLEQQIEAHFAAQGMHPAVVRAGRAENLQTTDTGQDVRAGLDQMKVSAADAPLDPAVVGVARPHHQAGMLEDRFGLRIDGEVGRLEISGIDDALPFASLIQPQPDHSSIVQA